MQPPPEKKSGTARVTGSRVLTSDEGYAILREKEDKKIKEKEEKEKRKQEREEKKRQKEELAKKKAEEKEELAKKKAEQKEELAKKKAEQKAKKLFLSQGKQDASDRMYQKAQRVLQMFHHQAVLLNCQSQVQR